LLAIFLQGFTTDYKIIGIIVGLPFLTSTFTSLYLLKFEDKKIDYVKLRKIAYFLQIVTWLAFLLAGDIYWVALGQLVGGVADAIVTISFQVFTASHLDKNKSLREFSLWRVILNLTIFIAGILGGWIAGANGFKALFVIMIVVTSASLILVRYEEEV
jgi:MFS family permease